MFIIGTPAWRLLGEYVTLDRTSSFQTIRNSSSPQLLAHSLPYRIPPVSLYYKQNNYTMHYYVLIICINDNNAVIYYHHHIISIIREEPNTSFDLYHSCTHAKEFLHNLTIWARVLKKVRHPYSMSNSRPPSAKARPRLLVQSCERRDGQTSH